jgi:hypothetical protein
MAIKVAELYDLRDMVFENVVNHNLESFEARCEFGVRKEIRQKSEGHIKWCGDNKVLEGGVLQEGDDVITFDDERL